MRSSLFIFLLFLSAALRAAPVEWTIQDAVFDDGAALSGSFTIGVEAGSGLTDINLSFTGGSLSDTDYHFDSGNGLGADGFYFRRLRETDLGPADLTGERVLELAIIGDIYTAGIATLEPVVDYADVVDGPPPGTYFFYTREVFCGDASCLPGNVVVAGGRNLISGSLVGVELSVVPIPAAVWLFGSALAGLGWLRRKQVA